jgi:hypothetical protein
MWNITRIQSELCASAIKPLHLRCLSHLNVRSVTRLRYYTTACDTELDATLHQERVNGHRAYYYYLDEHGQLFMHDTQPRNITTCKLISISDRSILSHTYPSH